MDPNHQLDAGDAELMHAPPNGYYRDMAQVAWAFELQQFIEHTTT